MTARRKVKPRRRGSITKTKQGGFLARVRLAPDALTGKRGGASKSCGTKAEAEAWLSEELARMDRGDVVGAGNSKRTLQAFLTDFYLHVRKSTRGEGVLSVRTSQDELALCALYVFRRAPGLASTPLSKLTIPQCPDYFRDLSAAGLAAATVSRMARILRARLNYACAAGELRVNPMTSPLISVSGKKKRQRAILSGVQARALFDVLPVTAEGVYIAMLLWCGLRPSEAAGLVWDDVDLDARVVRVRCALVRTTPTDDAKGLGTSWTIGPTKTGNERVVPLTDEVVAMLRRHRAMQAETKLAAGREYENSGLCFASAFGKPLHVDLIAARFLKVWLRDASMRLAGFEAPALPSVSRSPRYAAAVVAKRAREDEAAASVGFPAGIGLYSLRHCFALRLASEGVPVKTIQELMGHASIVTTLTSYVHTDADAARKAVDKLEAALGGKPQRLSIA